MQVETLKTLLFYFEMNFRLDLKDVNNIVGNNIINLKLLNMTVNTK